MHLLILFVTYIELVEQKRINLHWVQNESEKMNFEA